MNAFESPPEGARPYGAGCRMVAWIRKTEIAGPSIQDNSNTGAIAPFKALDKIGLGEHGSDPAWRPFRAHMHPIEPCCQAE